jgi:hypothetical protein
MPELRSAAVGVSPLSGNALRSVHRRPLADAVIDPAGREPMPREQRTLPPLRSRAEQIADQLAAEGQPPNPTIRRLPTPSTKPRPSGG